MSTASASDVRFGEEKAAVEPAIELHIEWPHKVFWGYNSLRRD
ncbi:hypothetical protein [Pseudomonas fluorescens]|nr:hypothetical protein [Pseudomonas fluorescens]